MAQRHGWTDRGGDACRGTRRRAASSTAACCSCSATTSPARTFPVRRPRRLLRRRWPPPPRPADGQRRRELGERVACGVLDAPARLVERAAVAELLDERDDARPCVGHVVARRRVGIAGDHDHVESGLDGQLQNPADHLAVEALPVEIALAGDDDVGRAEPVVQVDVVGDEVEAGDQPSADREQSAGEPAGGARAVDVADVDAEASDVVLGDPVEPGREQVAPGPASRPSAVRTRWRRRRSGSARRTPPGARSSGLAPSPPIASTAPSPPSVVAEPPSPTTTVRGALLDRPGDQFAGAGCRGVRAGRCRPARRPARARWRVPSRSPRCGPCSRHGASTGTPSGPVTRLVRFAPPSTSRMPSPPSDIGHSSTSRPSSQHADATAATASCAETVPRNLSSAARTRIGPTVPPAWSLGVLGPDRGGAQFPT